MSLIELHNVSKSYGNINALQNINLKINQGEIYGLLGPNGAGKTTTINIIAGLVKPDSGELRIHANGKIKEIMGIIPQEMALYEELTVIDNLMFFASIYDNVNVKQTINRVVELTKLGEKLNYRTSTLSGGLKRRLNLAIGLVNNPEILLMDEPTVGIDPQSRNFIYDNILQLKASGKTILYTTHYLEEAEKLCDKITIIDEGSVIREGTLSEILTYKEELILKFSNQEVMAQELAKHGIRHFITNSHIHVQSSNTTETLTKITDICGSVNVLIEDVGMKKPSLQDLFLELTGKHLRE